MGAVWEMESSEAMFTGHSESQELLCKVFDGVTSTVHTSHKHQHQPQHSKTVSILFKMCY